MQIFYLIKNIALGLNLIGVNRDKMVTVHKTHTASENVCKFTTKLYLNIHNTVLQSRNFHRSTNKLNLKYYLHTVEMLTVAS